MSDQTRIQTAGPVDPNAPLAAKAYTVTAGVLGLVGIAATFGMITQEQAASLGAVGTATTTLVGAVVAAVARFRVGKQINNGTFDPPVQIEVPVPVPAPPMSPGEKIVSAVQDAKTISDEVSTGLGRIKDILGVVPGIVALTPDMPGELDDLLRRFAAGQAKPQG